MKPSRLASSPRTPWLMAIGLAGLVVAIYWQVSTFGFADLDDHLYVFQNPWVLRGLTMNGVTFAFVSGYAANWHPLTWLSHMADVWLFGLEPGRHHVVNVFLHLANTLLLFSLLRTSTGATWRSGFVAALFAVHPLHVESVAWISERKDVLSTFFLLLALLAWVRYTRAPSAMRYLLVVGLFVLGLLSKPMVVTLPFLLLLLDAWPLGRMSGTEQQISFSRSTVGPLVREKLPLFILSAVSCVVAYIAQAGGGAMDALTAVPLRSRVENAFIAYATYLSRTIWPSGLAAFYPWPAITHGERSWWAFPVAAALFTALSLAAWRERFRRPYVGWGWLWYIGALVPVIGLVQVGEQALADRYTYIPLIGVFVALVWACAEWVGASPQVARLGVAVGLAVLAPLSIASWRQVSYWRDGSALFGRALSVTERNYVAWAGLASVRLDLGMLPEAIAASDEALKVMPRHPEAWNTKGAALGRLGNHDLAIPCFQQALRTRPTYPEAWKNLGTAYGSLGRYGEAAAAFEEAAALRPEDAETLASLGLAKLLIGDRPGALAALDRLRPLDPARASSLSAQISGHGARPH